MHSFKLTGAELKKFWNDPAVWGDQDWYYEDSVFVINGVDNYDVDVATLSDADEVVVDGDEHRSFLGQLPLPIDLCPC